jgi:hypothetical protein
VPLGVWAIIGTGFGPSGSGTETVKPVSDCRQQAWIEAPVEVVWDLIADVNRHLEWWPRVVDVQCDGLELTAAQDGTFVDGRFGMDPADLGHRVFDAVAGKRYFRRWLANLLEAMREAAVHRRPGRPSLRG